MHVDSQFWCANLPDVHDGKNGYRNWNRSFAPQGNAWKFLTHLWRKWHKYQRRAETHRWLTGRPAGLEIFSTPRSQDSAALNPMRVSGSVLHLHWIAGLLDLPTFWGAIPNEFPIVWTLHDMNPFTGGCHFSGGCEGFTRACGSCPQLGRPEVRDLSYRSFQVKRRAYAGKNLHIVAPSRWLAREAQRSPLFDGVKSIACIPYGLDSGLFSPHVKSAARKTLDLPAQGVIVAFGADMVTNRRKGLQELTAALSLLKTSSHVVGLVFGGGDIGPFDTRLSEIRHLGYISDPRRQALIYSAADLVVVPSLEDNLPNVGLEAMSCGTPVVGFDVGGIPDFTRPGETGLLAAPGDAAHLAHQIGWLVDHPDDRLRMGHNARKLIEREYSLSAQAQAYVALYERLLQSRGQGGGRRRAA